MRAIVLAGIAMLVMHTVPVQAGGGSGSQGRSAQSHQPRSHPAQQPGQAHPHFGGPRLERRADPNDLNPYRPMYSLDATNPGEPHPYFRTRKDGFGYPAAPPGGVYQGNGIYVVPR